MSTGISEQYRLLAPEEAEQFGVQCANAWKDPEIPRRQYDLVVRQELEAFAEGRPVLPYDVLVECLKELPRMDSPCVLDVGCASGYYFDVLRIADFKCFYHGVDFSEALIAFARTQHQCHGQFSVGDAIGLEFQDGSFDVVIHGACLMHLSDWPTAIREAARVASRYVIFHRTAIVVDQPTEYWSKEAYGVSCLEVHFEHKEFMKLCESAGLKCLATKTLFFDEAAKSGHMTFVMEKG